MADMTNFAIVPDTSLDHPTTELIPNTNTNQLEIKAISENIIKNTIPSSTSETPGSTTAYMQLFNTLVQFGTADPSTITDLRCRIYIKFDS